MFIGRPRRHRVAFSWQRNIQFSTFSSIILIQTKIFTLVLQKWYHFRESFWSFSIPTLFVVFDSNFQFCSIRSEYFQIFDHCDRHLSWIKSWKNTFQIALKKSINHKVKRCCSWSEFCLRIQTACIAFSSLRTKWKWKSKTIEWNLFVVNFSFNLNPSEFQICLKLWEWRFTVSKRRKKINQKLIT